MCSSGSGGRGRVRRQERGIKLACVFKCAGNILRQSFLQNLSEPRERAQSIAAHIIPASPSGLLPRASHLQAGVGVWPGLSPSLLCEILLRVFVYFLWPWARICASSASRAKARGGIPTGSGCIAPRPAAPALFPLFSALLHVRHPCSVTIFLSISFYLGRKCSPLLSRRE